MISELRYTWYRFILPNPVSGRMLRRHDLSQVRRIRFVRGEREVIRGPHLLQLLYDYRRTSNVNKVKSSSHSSEIEDFVESHICNLYDMYSDRAYYGVCMSS